MSTATTQSTNTAAWRAKVEDWQSSGLPMARYCEQKNLNAHQLSYYKRKFERAGPQPARQSGFSKAIVSSTPNDTGLTLHLANGVAITGVDGRNLSLIKPLLAILS